MRARLLAFFTAKADDLELEAVRIELERCVMLPVLRELSWRVEDVGVLRDSPCVRFADDRATGDHECDVLEACAVT